jgi:hypothetical protein
MSAHADKTQGSQSRPVANALTQKHTNDAATLQLLDNRPAVVQMREGKALPDNRSRPQKLVDNRPQAIAQRKLQAIQAMPLVIQRAVVAPTLTPAGGKAMQADLNLAVGDTTAAGGKPSVSPVGWNSIKNLGLTKGNTNWKKWVRFHLVNEDQGGPDDVNNLPVTTQKANHDSNWLNLEFELDKAAKDPNERPLKYYSFVTYPASRTVRWTITNGKSSKIVTTNSAHYPNQIYGNLSVKGVTKATATLTDTEGAIAPEELKKVPKAVAKDLAGNVIVGTKG